MKARQIMQSQPWIKLRVKELPGKTLRGLGQVMGGLDGSRLTEIMAGTRRVQQSEAEAMAVYLELPYEVVHGRLFGSIPAIGGDVRSPSYAQTTTKPPAELRVYGARDLGGGVMEFSNEPVADPAAQAFVQPTPDSYTCYVVTDHMSPAYEVGDQILINPLPPVSPGHDVLLISGGQEGTPRKATLRRLIKDLGTHWHVQQLNPPKTDKLDQKVWHTAQRVVAVKRR